MKDVYKIKLFEQLVDELWENRKKWKTKEEDSCFDYPEYCGISKKISSQLNSYAVDIIQELIMDMFKTKKQFEIAMRESFFVLCA